MSGSFMGQVGIVPSAGGGYLGDVGIVGGLTPTSIPIGIPITGGASGAILYEDAAQHLAADTSKLFVNPADGRVSFGSPVNFAARLTLYGDTVTGNIMQWLGAGGLSSVLMSCNGFSPVNLGIPFHVNCGGTTDGFESQEDNFAGGEGRKNLSSKGFQANRTVPQVRVRLGPTPAAGGHALGIFASNDITQLCKIASSGVISCTPSVATGEAFGNAAVSNNSFTTALGDTASSTGAFSSAFGSNTIANSFASFACGPFANATADSSFANGVGSTASGVSSIAIGRLSNTAHADSIALGHLALSTATGQFVVGSAAHPITQVYLGAGVVPLVSSAGANVGINPQGALGPDATGGLLGINGGRSTGGNVGNGIAFSTSDVGIPGNATLNPLTEKIRIDGLGNLILGATSGSTATKNLVLSNNATDPAAVVDRVYLSSKDIAAGQATLNMFTEKAVVADVGLASTDSLTVFINGLKYKIPLVLVP